MKFHKKIKMFKSESNKNIFIQKNRNNKIFVIEKKKKNNPDLGFEIMHSIN
jgi:hypothetical protein